MSPSPTSRTRIVIVLLLALGGAAAAFPFWQRASVTGGHRAAAQRRLGRATLAVVAPRFVEQALLERLQAAPDIGTAFRDAAPLIAVDGIVASDDGAALVPRVAVYGVDDRFWRLHGIAGVSGPSNDDLVASPALVDALRVSAGSTVTLTIAHGEDAPRGTLHGRRDDVGRTLRLRLAVLPGLTPSSLAAPPEASRAVAESLSPLAATEEVPVAFVPLALLQAEPEWRGRVNAIVLSADPATDRRINTATVEAAVARHATLADYGLSLRIDEATRSVVLDSRTGLLDDHMVDAATRAALDIGGLPTPISTILVNTIRNGNRSVPYSFVTSIELQAIAPQVHAEELDRPPIVLNDWAARALGASVGDVLSLEFPVWQGAGRLTTESAPFQVAGVLPMAGSALQPALTPAIPGITGRATMRDWTPRVPFDASRVQPEDEAYWTRYGTTPKAFVPPQVARALWRTELGSASAVLIAPADGAALPDARRALDNRLRERVAPALVGIAVRDVAADARTLADASGREISALAWTVAPFVLACLLAATIRCAAARITPSEAMSLALAGTFVGLVASPMLTALGQLLHARAAGPAGAAVGFTASIVTATTPLLVSLVTGSAAALLLRWIPARLTRQAARGAVVTVVALTVCAAVLVLWTTRSGNPANDGLKRTPSGGYPLFVRTTLPVLIDPTTPEGVAALGLSSLPDVDVMAFRTHDSSRATLQHPVGPPGLRLAAVGQAFIDEGRFTFTASLDRTDEERANPWLLLRREQRDRSDSAEPIGPIVPAITSARTLSTLQRHLGDDLTVSVSGRTLRFRIVATLEDALFDGALLMPDAAFMAWFPDAAGYHWLAVDAPRDRIADVRAALASALSRLGGTIVDGDAAARAFDRRATTGVWFACALFASACLTALSTLPASRSLRP